MPQFIRLLIRHYIASVLNAYFEVVEVVVSNDDNHCKQIRFLSIASRWHIPILGTW